MNIQNLLSFILFSLIFTCHANPIQNRVRRLSHGLFNEEAIRLGKFAVSIRTRNAKRYFGDNHYCSGVILAPKIVLTSVYCLMNHRRVFYDSRMYLIVAGTPNRLKYVPGRTFVSLVKKILVPTSFTLYNKQDVGLLYIKNPFPRDNPFIGIAKLPHAPPPMGLKCEVMGWGRMFWGGPLASYLVYIDVQLIPAERCAKLLNVPVIGAMDDLLCAMDEENTTKQQPCYGDWGSPLMHGDIVYGIVSNIVGCGSANLPSVYTDVYKMVDWIEDKIETFSAGVFYFIDSLVLLAAAFAHLGSFVLFDFV